MEGRVSYQALSGHKALALAVIHQATKEMRDIKPLPAKPCIRRERSRLRIDAVAWLASSDATRWFDGCDLDQRYALGRMKWAEHAQRLLDDDSAFLGRGKALVLEIGLDGLRPTE